METNNSLYHLLSCPQQEDLFLHHRPFNKGHVSWRIFHQQSAVRNPFQVLDIQDDDRVAGSEKHRRPGVGAGRNGDTILGHHLVEKRLVARGAKGNLNSQAYQRPCLLDAQHRPNDLRRPAATEHRIRDFEPEIPLHRFLLFPFAFFQRASLNPILS